MFDKPTKEHQFFNDMIGEWTYQSFRHSAESQQQTRCPISDRNPTKCPTRFPINVRNVGEQDVDQGDTDQLPATCVFSISENGLIKPHSPSQGGGFGSASDERCIRTSRSSLFYRNPTPTA